MNSKTIQAALMFIGLLILGMFLAQWIVTLPEFFQIFTICVFIVLALLLVIKPKVGLDIKFLCFICLGYAIGGKGFAYISPFEPFYISEVCLLFCLLGTLLRLQTSWKFLTIKNPLVLMIFLFIMYSGLRLALFDFPRFGLVAVRDSAIAYYGLFTICVIAACRKDENYLFIKKSFLWMGPLALIGILSNLSGLTGKLIEINPYIIRIFGPASDVGCPLIVAWVIMLYLKGLHKSKPSLLLLAVIGFSVLLMSKTAAIFGLGVTIMVLTFYTGRREFIISGILGGVTLFVVYAIALLSGFDLNIESDHLDTLTSVSEFDIHNNSDTTGWRLSWWRTIAEDTWAQAPFMGFGYGGDISIPFFEEFYGFAITEADLASGTVTRYPHNIIFTVLGRLGFPVAVVFCIYLARTFIFMGKTSKALFSRGKLDYTLLMAVCFVIAGLANSVIQMTFEGPFAAIPHWTALGFVYSFVRRSSIGLDV